MAAIKPIISGLAIIEFPPGEPKCVIKKPRFDVHGSKIDLGVTNIRHEGDVLKRLKHRNIICFVEMRFSGTHLVLERLDGEDLDCMIQNRKVALSAYCIARQLFSAVDYVHQEGFVHGDITTQNIRIIPHDEESKEVRVILLDFGAAGKVGEATRWGPATIFRSPEQIFSAPLSFASDVWNAGLVIALVRARMSYPYVHIKLTKHPDYGNAIPSAFHLRALREKFEEDIPGEVLEKLQKSCPEGQAAYAARTVREYKAIDCDISFFEDAYRGPPFRFGDPLGRLVRKMLNHDPDKRITASQAAKDPCFTEA